MVGGDKEERSEIEEELEKIMAGGDFEPESPDADGTAEGAESTEGVGSYNDTKDGPSGEGPTGG